MSEKNHSINKSSNKNYIQGVPADEILRVAKKATFSQDDAGADEIKEFIKDFQNFMSFNE